MLGSDGRVGRLLRRAWQARPPEGLRVLWAGRGDGADIVWNIANGPAPALPDGAIVLNLAGVVRGDADALGQNAAIGAALLTACAASGVRAVLSASTAAVYAPGADPADEDTPLRPANPYGAAKARAEVAMTRIATDTGVPLTHLRLGNVLGADALFGPRAAGAGPIRLDPVPGRDGGPVRSWIGPVGLAGALSRLCALAGQQDLPPVLNLAADPPLSMGSLLAASGLDWAYGPENPAVVPDAVLSTARLRRLCPLPPVSAASLIAELRGLGVGLAA